MKKILNWLSGFVALTLGLMLSHQSYTQYQTDSDQYKEDVVKKEMFFGGEQHQLSFEENLGQVQGDDSDKVRFIIRDRGLDVFILDDGIAYQYKTVHYTEETLDDAASIEGLMELSENVRTETFRMDALLDGSNKNAVIIKEGKSSASIHYYNHNALNVHNYQKITYKEIYPKIDWILFFRDGKMEYEFIVYPGGNPCDIKIQYQYAQDVLLQEDGSIMMTSLMGNITDKAPVSFQGDRNIVTSYVLYNNKMQFQVSDYDPGEILVIDPVVEWATYYGGSNSDYGISCTVDESGNVYLCGHTISATSIASGGHQMTYAGGGQDAMLVKFNASGVRQWATYYGGPGFDNAWDCKTDGSGNVYLAGSTNSSSNISTAGSHQPIYGGLADAYLVKFNSDGVRLWGTYYGGSGNDYGFSCNIDAMGDVYMSGNTSSTSNISTAGSHQPAYGGGINDAYLVKFNSAGVREWATYYGGPDSEINGVNGVDMSGDIYMIGITRSTSNISTAGSHQEFFGGGTTDAFLVKFNTSGVREWATYYGGASAESTMTNASVDALGNIYLSGTTTSTSNIAIGGVQNILGGSSDAFLVKFNTSGVREWGTYYGGNNIEYGFGSAVDDFGNSYISGRTTSTTSIASDGHQNTYGGGGLDAFLVKIYDCPLSTHLYVDSSVAISGDGSSWETALNSLALAIKLADECPDIDTIFVAQGTYHPEYIPPTTSSTTSRDRTFYISRDGLAILGGYPSGGGVRDFEAYPAIMSGDINAPGVTIDNAYHVMLIVGDVSNPIDSTLYIDGFKILYGNSNTGSSIVYEGVNIRRDRGGGIYNLNYSSPSLNNLSISKNNGSNGGGMSNYQSSSPALKNVQLLQNTGTLGAGMYNVSNCSPTLINIVVSGNSALNGAGIYNIMNCSPILLNVKITGNRSNSNGGAMCNHDNSSPFLKNVTISGNSSTASGGCMHNVGGIMNISNTIIYGNTSGIVLSSGGSMVQTYSLVQGEGSTADGNIAGTTDPMFVDPVIPSLAPTVSGDYRLLPCSPLLNIGHNDSIPSWVTFDLDNESRIAGDIIDFGAYESPFPVDLGIDTLEAGLCLGDSILFRGVWYSVTGIYTDTVFVAGGCDSIYVLDLTVHEYINTNIEESICTGESYLGYAVTGVYHDTFTSALGCDSIRILELTVHPVPEMSIEESVCSGESYLGYSLTGVYHDTFTSAMGCDSIRVLDLTVYPVPVTNLEESICFGTSHFGYSVTGLYHDTFTSALGCDSIRILELTVHPVPVTNMEESVCFGGSYLGYSLTGVYHDTFTSAMGCDSIRVLDLTVHPVPVTNMEESVCSGESHLGYSVTGIYHDTFTSALGCDSIRILDLTVAPVYSFTLDAEVCSGESYFGYTATGTYYDTFMTVYGCDSTRILNLSVHPVVYTTLTDTVCSGESLYGYSVSGTYVDTFISMSGCDSIVTLNLTVLPTYSVIENLTLCSNDLPYSFLGVTIPSGTASEMSYATVSLETAHGCDSIITINLTVRDTSRVDMDTLVCHGVVFEWNGIEISGDGDYYFTGINIQGCDSVVLLSVHYSPVPLYTDSFIRSCGEAEYNGIIYTRDTLLVDTFRTVIDCDSVYRQVHIDVMEIIYDTLSAGICAGEQYDFNGVLYGSAGLYTQVYTHYNGCDSFVTLDLLVHALPDVELFYELMGEEDILCIGDTVLLIGLGAEFYIYYDVFDDILKAEWGDSQLVRVNLRENTYYVIGTDENGCSMRSDLTIYGEDCCDILVPNAFSPNGDGLNDLFGVVTLGHPERFHMQIFDRWGKLVFVSHNHNVKWDGLLEGKPLNPGIYFYVISSICSDGTPFNHKGEVNLLR